MDSILTQDPSGEQSRQLSSFDSLCCCDTDRGLKASFETHVLCMYLACRKLLTDPGNESCKVKSPAYVQDVTFLMEVTQTPLQTQVSLQTSRLDPRA